MGTDFEALATLSPSGIAMTTKAFLAATAALLTACTSTPGDRGAAAPASPAATLATFQGPIQMPSVHGLIGRREALGLTSQQVNALDSIGIALTAANRPVEARLEEQGSRSRTSNWWAAVAPIYAELSANNKRAMEGVRSTLSAEQRTQVCRIQSGIAKGEEDEWRRRRALNSRRGAPNSRRQRMAIAADSALRASARTWAWCTPDGGVRS